MSYHISMITLLHDFCDTYSILMNMFYSWKLENKTNIYMYQKQRLYVILLNEKDLNSIFKHALFHIIKKHVCYKISKYILYKYWYIKISLQSTCHICHGQLIISRPTWMHPQNHLRAIFRSPEDSARWNWAIQFPVPTESRYGTYVCK